MARKRARWHRYQGRIDPTRLVFVDETWAKTNMTRTRGWAPRGKRLVASVPCIRWATMTFLAGLRADGIVAPLVLDGPINGEVFRAWVEQFLVPTLRPGDAVIMDNLGSHKGQAVRQAIRKAGAHLLFLPPYSPDLNPIEMAFSKLRPCCAAPMPGPSPPSGTASARCRTSSAHANAQTTSGMQDTDRAVTVML